MPRSSMRKTPMQQSKQKTTKQLQLVNKISKKIALRVQIGSDLHSAEYGDGGRLCNLVIKPEVLVRFTSTHIVTSSQWCVLFVVVVNKVSTRGYVMYIKEMYIREKFIFYQDCHR